MAAGTEVLSAFGKERDRRRVHARDLAQRLAELPGAAQPQVGLAPEQAASPRLLGHPIGDGVRAEVRQAANEVAVGVGEGVEGLKRIQLGPPR